MNFDRALDVARANNASLDDRDQEILNERAGVYLTRETPQVGDFCIMPDGEKRRFTHDWDDALQTTWKGDGGGSFYLGKGYVSYSGSLEPSIPLERIAPTEERWPGVFWFFHHNEQRAHNGVQGVIPVRVWQVSPCPTN